MLMIRDGIVSCTMRVISAIRASSDHPIMLSFCSGGVGLAVMIGYTCTVSSLVCEGMVNIISTLAVDIIGIRLELNADKIGYI